ncbi:MAG: F0F1 ATP synthase subunit A [Solirubrobacterales bacterium]
MSLDALLEIAKEAKPLFYIGDSIGVPNLVVTEWAIIIILGTLAFFATRNMQTVPRGLQNGFEAIVGWTFDFFGQMLGEKPAKIWTPVLSTFFLFILASNYSGLIPGSGVIKGFQPPTSDWNVTMTLALIVFFTIHVAGFRQNGLHYLGHFVSPYAAFLPLNLIEEVARPLSLTLRLFGNIFGEEMIIGFLLTMAPFLVPMPMMALGLLTGAIQAIVFTILASSYIGAATSEGH